MEHIFISKKQKKLLPGKRVIEQTNAVEVTDVNVGLANKKGNQKNCPIPPQESILTDPAIIKSNVDIPASLTISSFQ
jgi:hypothetical protein